MVGVQERTVSALMKYYGLETRASEIHWFEEHYEADQEHGQRAFDMLAIHVDTEALATQCLWWAEEGLKARWLYVTEVEATVRVRSNYHHARVSKFCTRFIPYAKEMEWTSPSPFMLEVSG